MHEDDFIEFQEKSSFEDQIILSAFKNDRTIYLWGDINDNKALIFTRMMDKLCVEKNGIQEPITLIVSSLGGEVFSGLTIISAIEKAQKKGYSVICKVYGIAMSMGVNIVATCSKRIGAVHSRYLIHDLGGFFMGMQSREESRESLDEQQQIWERIEYLYSRDTKVTPEYLNNITAHKRNYSFWAEEALELGIIDEIE